MNLVQLVSIVAVSLLLVFWAWMFWDMTNNDRLPGSAKTYWTFAFVFASVFAAIYYYVNVYKSS